MCLVFGLLDELIERIDYSFLDALDALARAALREATADVFHATRNVVERIVVFQAFHVVTHQVGQLLVADGQLLLALDKLSDCGVGFVGVDELMMRDSPVEEQRFGSEDLFGRRGRRSKRLLRHSNLAARASEHSTDACCG